MYIRATAGISPQPSFERLLTDPVAYPGNRLRCVEPDYTARIDAKMIRRMSRIIKMGVAAALDCLEIAGIEMPGAIITGTAYGCLTDTEAFLSRMVENQEELLTPTSFIQSTHNTIGAQIALLLKCHQYNNTFVHRGFSFESALLDAVTLLEDGEIKNALIGGIDELTDTSYTLLSRFGLYKKDIAHSGSLFTNKTKGTLAGEGSCFFLLSAEPSGKDYAKLKGMTTVYKPGNTAEVKKHILDFLSAHETDLRNIDMILTGRNGNIKDDLVYDELEESIFKDKPAARFKHLCGEYPTASAFALWLAANSIKTGKMPGCTRTTSHVQNPKTILIYNHYQNTHHSLYLLTAC